MKRILLTLSLLIFSLAILADTTGEAGFQMLKVPTGATTSAQGGVGAFTANDAFGFMSNPTAGMLPKKRVISFSHNYWLIDYQMNSGAYYYSQGKKAFGFGYRYLDYGKLESRDDVGNITGEFHPMDMVLTTNFGYRITPDMYLAANLNALYEKIDAASAVGLAFDIGYTYLTPIKDLTVAAAVKNIGKTGDMDKEDIDLPIAAEISLIKALQLKSVKFANELKIMKYSDNDELQMVLGTNIHITEILKLRLGYKLNYDAEDFSAGIGIKLKKIDVDYAYVPFNSEIDDVHVIGLTYKF
ncbi:MAG: PorV/PorQ family protein [Candidatus Cloacimonetes bacterium]|nr:PorV/PorQ family protein [Candidatus Cloacimonadota bacterium]MCF7814281.1 PorV/PorQ family protein [Candidatus Cloacimonadota bacterium]MCF7868942.1 PorV/PorQ family protein [Candidatus Cloacimonadota bacterium]MCF7884322.1 PorV/PorQ family protein [Candidatus Cloacimonadota bacterium]